MRLLRLAALLVLASASACTSYWSDGPAYAPSHVPSGYALVTVYRPKKASGAAQLISAKQPGRNRDVSLWAGTYATFVVPAGHVELATSIDVWTRLMFAPVPGVGAVQANITAKPTRTSVELDAADGESYFIRTEFDGFEEPPLTVSVSRAEAESDLDDLSMAPGGRGRYPISPVATP